MKVAGFTFIRNAIKYDFPVVESILSILPLCDEFYVAVGHSEDKTRELIKAISPDKIRITDTTWNPDLQSGGAVYADETNKAFDSIPDTFDWCFYIQGDEVIHEKYIPGIRKAMQENLTRPEVDGLLLTFRHFYGTYDYVGDSRRWYRNEIRIIRNDKSIRSYRDAQGFRKSGKKLKVVPVNAEVFHYGWVRHPRYMQEKIEAVKVFYQGITNEQASVQAATDEFSYSREYDALARFEGTHPFVMKERIRRLNWQVDVDLNKKNLKPRYRILYWFEKLTGIRLFEYRNYQLIKMKFIS
jgi:hypothetical protein